MEMKRNLIKGKKENAENSILQTDISFQKKGVYYISIVLLAVVLLLFANTVFMRYKLVGETKRYVADVSTHTVSSLSYVLRENSLCIEEMSESFSKMPEELLTEELLARKASSWKLDGLALVSPNGDKMASADFCQRFDQWMEKHPEIFEKSVVSYILDHKIIFSSPVIRNGICKGALVGVKNYDTVQKFLSDTDLCGKGESYILSQDGKIIFRPENHFIKIPEELLMEQVEKEKGKIQDIKDLNGAHVLLSVRPLEINGWKLKTVVPRDILADVSIQPVIYFVLIIVVCIVVFFMILRYIRRTQSNLIQRLKTFAFVDPITEGRNIQAFQMDGDKLLSAYKPGYYALIFLNVFNFKQINERWGLEAGNRALKYIYDQIEKQLDREEAIARSEIDHYFILLHYHSEQEILERVGRFINSLNSFRESRKPESSCYVFDFSVGAYVLKNPEEDFFVCLGKARRAAGFGKVKNICSFYDNRLVEEELYQKHLNEMFENALEKEEFEIYLQPKVHIREKKLSGAEALIRWNSGTEGMIYPSDFIPLFEKNGKICRLDMYVLEKVCIMLRERMEKGETLFPVSVNLSRAHLNAGYLDFVKDMIALKQKYQIPDGILEMELTESIMLEEEQISDIKKIIDTFRNHGFLCSLDDFGFGFSSLGILKALNVDTIKLDRKFFTDENERTWFIVSHFVNMAHGLGITIVAEGIECAEQVEALKSADCDLIQGYYFGKPMPIPVFMEWYEKNKMLWDKKEA